jgi:predicted nucleotide-binding protein (sugar kinase/HSP70/actin superfamily)
MTEILGKHFPAVTGKQIRAAAEAGYSSYEAYFADLRARGEEFLRIAEKENRPVIVLCGRPYHVDPEINHGIQSLICRLGAVVVTEDSVSNRVEPFPVQVRNQWTYHARLYAAAKWVAAQGPWVNLVQLVSFGCGVDAITTDEVRSILEAAGKIYTQIKIDEISNMGAVNIRLRSLFAAVEEQARSKSAEGRSGKESGG